MSKVTFKNCSPAESTTITDFLWSMRDDFRFSKFSNVAAITDLLFEKGGVIGGYRDGAMVGMFGYFFGEPSRDYANKDTGFIYIAGLAKSVRRAGVFPRGVRFLVETLNSFGVYELRCHAAENDAYTNRLYSRLGQPIGTEKNRRGDTCILYTNRVDTLLAMLGGKNKNGAGIRSIKGGDKNEVVAVEIN